MAKPWEKYQKSDSSGPWAKYAKAEQPKAEQPQEYDYSNAPKDLLQGQVDALPMYGQVAGSMFGSVGAGLGQAAGNSLKEGINSTVKSLKDGTFIEDNMRLPTSDEITNLVNETVKNFNEGVVLDSAGQVLAKGAGVVSEAATSLKKKAGEAASDTAEKLAARSLGAERGTIKKLGQDKVQDMGRYALDNEIVTPLASTDDLIERNLAQKAKGGQEMQRVYSAIDDAGKSTFNPTKAADEVEQQLGDFWRDPLNKGSASQLDNTIEAIRKRAGGSTGSISLADAQGLKETLGKAADWNNKLNISDKNQIARDAYGIVSKQIDDAVQAGAEAIGTDDLLNILKEGKKLYSNAKGSEVLLQNKLAREQGNKLIGLTDTIAGAGAFGSGGLATSGGVVLAKKALENYGTQTTAVALDKTAKALLKTPAGLKLSQQAPQVFNGLVQTLTPKPQTQAAPMPKAAENQNQNEASNKFIEKGVEKLKAVDRLGELSASIPELKKSKRGQDLLLQASDMKPDSPGLKNIIEKIKQTEEYKKSVPKSSGYPRKLIKDGFQAVVKNEQEHREAISEGWA